MASTSSPALTDKDLTVSEGDARTGYHWCLTDEQRQMMKDFRAELRSLASAEWPDGLTEKENCFLNDDITMLKFLRSRRFDLAAATKMAWDTLKWRRGFQGIGVDNITESMITNEISTGKAFIYKTDNRGRPVGYVRVKLHDTSKRNLEELQRFSVFQMEIGREYIRPYQRIEKNCIVFDLDGFSLSNMDYEFVKFMIHMFQNYYPECMGCTLIVNSPWLFSTCWAIIKRWIDPVSVSKILFVTTEELKNHIPAENLPTEYGGTSGFSFAYVPPEMRNGEMIYVRGWEPEPTPEAATTTTSASTTTTPDS